MIVPQMHKQVTRIKKTWDSSVIRQKGKSQCECYKKTKHANFLKKHAFPNPWYSHDQS